SDGGPKRDVKHMAPTSPRRKRVPPRDAARRTGDSRSNRAVTRNRPSVARRQPGDPMPYDDILYDARDGVAWITINRPEVRNAFRAKTVDELIAAFRAAWGDQIGRAHV